MLLLELLSSAPRSISVRSFSTANDVLMVFLSQQCVFYCQNFCGDPSTLPAFSAFWFCSLLQGFFFFFFRALKILFHTLDSENSFFPVHALFCLLKPFFMFVVYVFRRCRTERAFLIYQIHFPVAIGCRITGDNCQLKSKIFKVKLVIFLFLHTSKHF